MKRTEKPMPLITRCGCLSLRTGCLLLCVLSTLACIVNITVGSWMLPEHRTRDPEDNLISLSTVMFSSLSAVSNVVALTGIWMNRPGNLQLSFLSNSVFILCIFLVTVVNCIFRIYYFFEQALYLLLLVCSMLAGAAYSIYYLLVVNSYYRTMKMSYGESAIPM